MRLLAALMLLGCLVTAGCADNADQGGQNRFGGFYGGVNAGAATASDHGSQR